MRGRLSDFQFILPVLVLLALWPAPLTAHPQICDNARINYIIRDRKGKIVDPSTLGSASFVKQVFEGWKRTVEKVPLSPTGLFKDAKMVKSLEYRGGNDCEIRLEEVTLKLGDQTMRLIFNLSLNSYKDWKHSWVVIDSPPFTQGTFRLEPGWGQVVSTDDWSRPGNQIPASAWRQVSE